jgi:hypothetical protein
MKINWKFVFNRFAWYITMLAMSIAFCMFEQVVLFRITDMAYVNVTSFLVAVVVTTTWYPVWLVVLHNRDKPVIISQ